MLKDELNTGLHQAYGDIKLSEDQVRSVLNYLILIFNKQAQTTKVQDFKDRVDKLVPEIERMLSYISCNFVSSPQPTLNIPAKVNATYIKLVRGTLWFQPIADLDRKILTAAMESSY